MKYLISLFFLINFSLGSAQPYFDWALNLNLNYHSQIISMDSDNASNIYVTGIFHDTVDFDLGIGVTELIASDSSDIFIAKYNSNCEFIWAKQLKSSSYGYQLIKIKVDINGNIIIAGSYSSDTDFDPGPGTYILHPWGINGFILKLTSDGDFVWAKQFYRYSSYVKDFETDSNGNIYAYGNFSGTIDFDPGVDTFNLIGNSEDIFITKLNENGEFIWAKQITGNGYQTAGKSCLTLDSSILLTGTFQNLTDFNPNSGYYTLNGGTSTYSFILKLNLDGVFKWVKPFHWINFNGIETNSNNEIICAGAFYNSADFDPSAGSSILTSNGGSDCFILKLTESGNYLWAYSFGEYYNDVISDMELDLNDNIYLNGNFRYICDFDPSIDTFELEGYGYGFQDVFYTKFTDNGDLIWAKTIVGDEDEYERDLEIDVTGNIYSCGNFKGSLNLSPDSTLHSLYSLNFSSFIFKWNIYALSTTEIRNPNNLLVYPNPVNDFINLKSEIDFKNTVIEILDMNGKMVDQFVNLNGNSFQLNLSPLSKGIYLLKVITANEITIKKISKI